jgi:hypothetical protein
MATIAVPRNIDLLHADDVFVQTLGTVGLSDVASIFTIDPGFSMVGGIDLKGLAN